jgi:hypothetical protein
MIHPPPPVYPCWSKPRRRVSTIGVIPPLGTSEKKRRGMPNRRMRWPLSHSHDDPRANFPLTLDAASTTTRPSTPHVHGGRISCLQTTAPHRPSRHAAFTARLPMPQHAAYVLLPICARFCYANRDSPYAKFPASLLVCIQGVPICIRVSDSDVSSIFLPVTR